MIKRILLLLPALTFVLFSYSMGNSPEARANELTRWMVDNLDLSKKELAAVQEISYMIAVAEKDGEITDTQHETINVLKKVLGDQRASLVVQEIKIK